MSETTNETGDVSPVESTASSESSSSPETQSAAPEQEAASSVEKPAPFHEHPRFKEIIDQNRQYREQLDNYGRQTQQMQTQMQEWQNAQKASQQPKPPSYDQVLERLKSIDPEFGSFQAQIAQQMAAVPQLQQQLQEFNEWKSQQDSQRVAQQATTTLNGLYSQFKVPDDLREDYEYRIKAIAYEKNLKVSDLEKTFKDVHETLSKRFQDRDRKQRESYVQDKQKDKVPTTQTGGAPAKIPGPSLKSFEDRASYIANALKASKNT